MSTIALGAGAQERLRSAVPIAKPERPIGARALLLLAHSARGAPVAALRLRLIGFAGVGFAIGRAKFRFVTAEMEFVFGRIANRLAAHAVVDGQHRGEIAILERDRIL